MKIIEPSYEILHLASAIEVFALIELAGRTCYKSEEKIDNERWIKDCEDKEDFYVRPIEFTSSYKFIKTLLSHDPPHLSVLEHSMMTVKFICDRGVSHELVRHRLCSFSQESTRYCNYSQGRFGKELTFIKPVFWEEELTNNVYDEWYQFCKHVENTYKYMIEFCNAKPEEARSVLPNSIKTEIVVTANLRQWGHIFYQRTSNKAHPQMRQLMVPLLEDIRERLPLIYDRLEIYK